MKVAAAILLLAPLCVMAVVGSAGCEREPAKPAATPAPATAPAQVYTVRGRINSLPSKDNPLSGLTIAHEEIPSFVGKSGTVVGMRAMVMPFTPAPELSLDGLAVGDPIEFVFEMRWQPKAMSQVTRITKLPPDTELVLPKMGH